MPKIIFTSRYLRDAPPAQLKNHVRYISTREGVEKVEGSRVNLPATAQQKDLVRQIVRDIPPAKEMLEYTDFLLRPTIHRERIGIYFLPHGTEPEPCRET